jgi:coenzyme F420 hydrogenase subunit beta
MTEQKNYEDLKREVWERGRCAGCGACVAVCPADAIVLAGGTTSLSPTHTGYCKDATDGVPCGACYAVCPRTPGTKPEGAPSPLLGEYQRIVAAKAAFDVARKQSGGAVTAILANALDEGLIDAVVTVAEDRFTLQPQSVVITSSEVLITQAGSRYNWWVPLLAALKEAVVRRKFRSIAVVGVPCAVQALHAMRVSRNDLVRPFGRSLRLIVGLFCTESFDYEKLVEGKLKTELGLETWQIGRLDVKGKLEVTMTDGSTVSIPLAELNDCIRPGCHICTDLTATAADISAGAIGSGEGYTTLIIRNDRGRGFVDDAVRHHRLMLTEDVDLIPIDRLAGRKAERNTRS